MNNNTLNRKKTLDYMFVVCGLFIFFIVNFYIGITVETILFYLNIILSLLIISKAQFSLFSVLTLISNYMLVNIYMVYKTGSGYGLLALTSHIYMNDINLVILIFNVSMFLWVNFSNILVLERNMLKNSLEFSINTCNIMAIFSVVMAYIAFPGFHFGVQETRFVSLLPGHFWNHFMVIFMLFAFPRIYESMLIKCCFVIVILWSMLHGERVDIIGLCLLLLILICIKKDYRINIKFFARFGIVFILLFSILIYIGYSRAGGNSSFSFATVVSSFLSQGTASDVGYVFNSSIDYTKNNPYLYGSSYITYLQGIIPSFDQPLRVGRIILEKYHTAGGEYFLIEPYMNFGMIGVAAILNIFILIVKKFLSKCTVYKELMYYFLISASFRYVWYGLTYIETGLIYLLPITYFLATQIFEKYRRLEYHNNG